MQELEEDRSFKLQRLDRLSIDLYSQELPTIGNTQDRHEGINIDQRILR